MFSPYSHCEFGSFNCLFSHAFAKHHAKSDILSSYTFQFLPVQSRKSSPYNEQCTQLVGGTDDKALIYFVTKPLRLDICC